MATPRSALGSQFMVGNGASPEVFTAVAAVGNISGPGLKADTVDVSNQNNTWKQFVIGLQEGGDIKFDLFFDPTDTSQGAFTGTGGVANGLFRVFQNRQTNNFKIVLPLSPTYSFTFNGVVNAFDFKLDLNGAIMANCGVKVNGSVSLVTP